MQIAPVLMATALMGLAAPAHAQEKKESAGPAVYQVEFEIRDGNAGADQADRRFTMLIDKSRKGVFRAASRVPVATGSSEYIDVGVSIECAVQASNGKAALHGSIELTSIAGTVNFGGSLSQPIVAQKKLAFNATVELGAPNVIHDDRTAKQRVEATVTKVN